MNSPVPGSHSQNVRQTLSPRVAGGPLYVPGQQGQPGAEARGGDGQTDHEMRHITTCGHATTSDLTLDSLKSSLL